MKDYGDLFDDDYGVMPRPTMRGSANLDVQDYQGYDGDSSILDDDLQEDTPSRPGSGAAPAPDIDGTDDYDFLEGDMDDPGMKQTTYGASPWGPGSSSGYRPYSQQRTDMALRALGDSHTPETKPMHDDEMMLEPEVIDAVGAKPIEPWSKEWHGNQNQMPSNADIDPLTLYDRSSYEYDDDSSQSTIGSGIFDVEEGVTFRPRDGIFANQYAVPAYLAEEDELGVQQSEMWDSTAGEWRVTQPSASGVPLSRKVRKLKPPPAGLRPEKTGPRSHVEAFGRKAARTLLQEAQAHQGVNRERFMANAISALGPNMTVTARKIADELIRLGYPANVAFEDALAHCVMHAAVRDLFERATGKTRSMLPRLDRMANTVQRRSSEMREHASKHLLPLTRNTEDLRRDLGALYASPCARGLGQAAEGEAPVATAPTPAASMMTTRNVLIAGGLGLGAFLVYKNRKKIVANVKKMVR